MRRKPNLEPRLEKCAHLLVAQPEALRGQWLERFFRNGVPDSPPFGNSVPDSSPFGNSVPDSLPFVNAVADSPPSGNDIPDKLPFRELHIELGCGKGLFAVETAKREPDILFIALERVANVIVIALERSKQEGLCNVRYINGLVDDLAMFFSEGEVSRIYINFCDPWPARRHVRRRLTGQRFLEIYKQVLRPGGEIHFKTDDLPLFEFSLNEFEQSGFLRLNTTRDLHKNGPVGIMTDYEKKFYEKGAPIYSCVVRTAK